MKPQEAVRAAARLLGSQAELARRLAVRTPTVSQWCSGDRPVPPARALQIEALTTGRVTRVELCPKFPWADIAA
ncbi:transcriptional regulator [Pseudomonas viridiflava]|uniref:transcriptional regulator n=1 Tax=Pseudomonas viridiflava TaxID=33069 RepID=UPI000F0200AE|nr:Cro/CI family transcriptional regulator [Pseudomonas viridiflava]MEE4148401.1 Cro/CI family transcriptional regulator [Pseudomonas viridiflava]